LIKKKLFEQSRNCCFSRSHLPQRLVSIAAELDTAHQEIQHMLEEKQQLVNDLKHAKEALAKTERGQMPNTDAQV
jgi:chaperonin cofactor prefoldin